MPDFLKAASYAVAAPRPKSSFCATIDTVLAFFAMYLAKALAIMRSSMLTRNCHSLPPLPLISRILGLLHDSVTCGTCSSLMMGIEPRHAPLCVWPTMTSTLSTSTSLRTALTASPGWALLSAK